MAAAAAPDIGLQLRLRAKIMEQLDSGAIAEMPPDVLRAELEPVIHQIAGQERVQLSARDQAQLAQELTDDMVGFGPLEPLLRDDSISDIMVNGPDTVFIEVRRQAAEDPPCGSAMRSMPPWWRRRWWRRSAGASTNRARSATRACPTAAASTSSSRRWRWTVPASRSASSPRRSSISPPWWRTAA